MKILLLTHTMPRFPGDTNSASFISELAEGLADQGNELIILAPYDPLFKNHKRPYKVITYKYIWPAFLHKSGYSRVLKGDKTMSMQMYALSTLMSFFGLINLIIVCKKFKIDLVTAHWVVPNGFIAFLASIITRVPYTITIPGSDVYLARKNLFFKLTTKLATLNAAWVFSDSQHYINELHTLGIKPGNTSVIRYGVNTKLLKPTAKNKKLLTKLNIRVSDYVILALGRFVEKKGFIYLIESMPKILKTNTNARLVLTGDGELMKFFQERVNKLKIGNNVIFTGAVPYNTRSTYYNLADIFVMPSVRDSMGNIDASPVAMMDAMSCGIPVIATKYSGSPDLVINGKTGYLVREKKSMEIAEAVIKLVKVKNRKKIKSDVRKIALDNFSLDSTAKKYTKIFGTIVKL